MPSRRRSDSGRRGTWSGRTCRPGARARTAQTPEELWIVFPGDAPYRAAGRHELDREQVVDRVAVLSFEAAHTAAERETADPRVSDNANGARQPVLLGRLVELLEERAARDARGPSRRVDLHGAHARKVDDHAAVARRESCD